MRRVTVTKETAAGQGDGCDCEWFFARGGQISEPVCTNTEDILHHSCGTGQMVVEDPFFFAEVTSGEWFNHP